MTKSGIGTQIAQCLSFPNVGRGGWGGLQGKVPGLQDRGLSREAAIQTPVIQASPGPDLQVPGGNPS